MVLLQTRVPKLSSGCFVSSGHVPGIAGSYGNYTVSLSRSLPCSIPHGCTRSLTSPAARVRVDSSRPGGCEVLSPCGFDLHFPSRCLLGSTDPSCVLCGPRAVPSPACRRDSDSHRPHILVQMGEHIRERYSRKPRNQELTRCQLVTRPAIPPPGAHTAPSL